MPSATPEWWKAFFDQDYLRIAGEIFSQEDSTNQAAGLWAMLDLYPGCRILDAPCGWGRLSRPLALLGGTVLGVDQSHTLLEAAEAQRGDVPQDRLRYLQHDLRTPLAERDFDLACNIFTSFGYGTEEDDLALFQTLREAVKPGGRVVVETNHRDLLSVSLARGAGAAKRMRDGTIFLDECEFDGMAGVAALHWYWRGPNGSGEKHAKWRCYTPTQIVALLEQAGLRMIGAYKGLSKVPYSARAGDDPTRLTVVSTRDE